MNIAEGEDAMAMHVRLLEEDESEKPDDDIPFVDEYVRGQFAYRVQSLGDSGEFAIRSKIGSRWDVYGIGYTSVAQARAEIMDVIDERIIKQRMMRMARVDTPWGQAYAAIRYGEGVYRMVTRETGGFRLSRERQEFMPPHLVNRSGFYDEDVDWSKVALGLPGLFSRYECEQAALIFAENYPALNAKHGSIVETSTAESASPAAGGVDHPEAEDERSREITGDLSDGYLGGMWHR